MSVVEEVLREWFGDALDDEDIVRCAEIVRQAAEEDRLAEAKEQGR